VATHDIIVIGASAGGVEAISALVSDLPSDLKAAVLVVLHLSRGRSVLPEILSRAGRLPARHPSDGERLLYGRIYVAPPDHHMTVEEERIRLRHGPTENGVRPAIDPLFRSAARCYGPRVVGVVLTGSLDDGTAGLAAVKEAKGVTVVQDPLEAFAPSMPRSAMEFVGVDHVLPLREIPVLLLGLVRERAAHTERLEGGYLQAMEPDLAKPELALQEEDRPGRVSVFTCPECHGTLWEAEEKGILRFRCRVGHVYSPDSMLSAQTDSVDRALWAALRSLEERAALTQKMADRARQRQHEWVARAFEERARVSADHAAVVRGLLQHRPGTQVVPDHSDAPELPSPSDDALAPTADKSRP
jgi:two-component system, chemotaxis family, protein-glutamate methylesterase/glutaminase